MQKIHNGAAIIITNNSCSKFFIQRKDDTYPLKECRGCISLFGGACDDDEDSETTIARELAEELVLDNIKITPKLWRNFRLHGNQFANTYEITVFTCFLTDEVFEELAKQIVRPQVVLEGLGEIVTREQLCKWSKDTSKFFASLDVVIDEFLQQH
ncbi:NUDIX domain-containing protein [Candidatus Uabimicrobium amorphum]|uniref:Nudix hydrolase domain-containing protein n=1 Tax=Uabimicrobium amorphum TaxID=2596890 RepID=A0A5S9IJI1_UABAM|nr:NUDIX hydrolase [Candidatus Uabimicrobium amorphum]BBM83008.1 hypothetical protein UABAM_01351 [Candidatus Uabimicrobium amorphum]